MTNVGQVLTMLCPNVEWSLIGENYEDIDWHGAEAPITKKQFTDGFAQVEAWLQEQALSKTAAKTALLAKLNITEEELAVLLG